MSDGQIHKNTNTQTEKQTDISRVYIWIKPAKLVTEKGYLDPSNYVKVLCTVSDGGPTVNFLQN